MTQVLLGDSLDVLHQAKKLGRLLRLEDRSNPKENLYLWKSRSLVPEVLVFVDPEHKLLDPKDLTPRQDRILAFVNSEPSKQWIEWIETNKLPITKFNVDPSQLVAFLVRGSEKLEIPRFTEEAAQHVVACNPGGKQAIAAVLELIRALELEEPIQYEDVAQMWPYVPTVGKVYSVQLRKLIGTISKDSSVQIASLVPEDEAFSTIYGLKTACKKYPFRVELLDMLIKGIYAKKWKPKAALLIFTHLCLNESEEKKWELGSKTMSYTSPMTSKLYQLFNIV